MVRPEESSADGERGLTQQAVIPGSVGGRAVRGGPTFPREFCIRALLHGVSNLPSVLQCPLAGFRSYDVLCRTSPIMGGRRIPALPGGTSGYPEQYVNLQSTIRHLQNPSAAKPVKPRANPPPTTPNPIAHPGHLLEMDRRQAPTCTGRISRATTEWSGGEARSPATTWLSP